MSLFIKQKASVVENVLDIFFTKRSSSKVNVLFYFKFLAHMLHVRAHAFPHGHRDTGRRGARRLHPLRCSRVAVIGEALPEGLLCGFSTRCTQGPAFHAPPSFRRVCATVGGASLPPFWAGHAGSGRRDELLQTLRRWRLGRPAGCALCCAPGPTVLFSFESVNLPK